MDLLIFDNFRIANVEKNEIKSIVDKNIILSEFGITVRKKWLKAVHWICFAEVGKVNNVSKPNAIKTGGIVVDDKNYFLSLLEVSYTSGIIG